MKEKVKVILIILICACFVLSCVSCKVDGGQTPPENDVVITSSSAYLSLHKVEQKPENTCVEIKIEYNSNYTDEEKTLDITAYYDRDILDVIIHPYVNGDEKVTVSFNGKRNGETNVKFLIKIGFELLQCELSYSNNITGEDGEFVEESLTYGEKYDFAEKFEKYGKVVYYDPKMVEKADDETYKIIGLGTTVIEFDGAKIVTECSLRDSNADKILKDNFPNSNTINCDDIKAIRSLRVVSSGVKDYSGLSILENLEKLVISEATASEIVISGIKNLICVEIENAKALTSLTVSGLSQNVSVELAGCPVMSKLHALDMQGCFRYITDAASSKPLNELKLYNIGDAVFDREEVLSALQVLYVEKLGTISNRQIIAKNLQNLTIKDTDEKILLVETANKLKNIVVSNTYFPIQSEVNVFGAVESARFENLKNKLGNNLLYECLKYAKTVELSNIQLESYAQNINIYPQNSNESGTEGYVNIQTNRLESFVVEGNGQNSGLECVKISEASSGNKISFAFKNVGGLKKILVNDVNKRFDVRLDDCNELKVVDIYGINTLTHGNLNNLTWLEVEMAGDYACNFSQLPKLEAVVVNSCKMTSLDFSKNSELNYIEAIANTNLTTLNIKNCRYLYAIKVRNCKLAKIEYSLVQMSSLERVELNDNKLTEVGFLSTAPDIKVLDIANNNISSLKCLSGCEELRELYIGGNKDLFADSTKVGETMSAVSKSIPFMLRLNIGTNNTSIATRAVLENVSKMKNLTWLQLYRTNINASLVKQYLNSEILTKLEFLDLRYNSLAESDIKSSFREETVLVCADDASDYKGEDLGSFATMSYKLSKSDYTIYR